MQHKGRTYILVQQAYIGGQQNPNWCSCSNESCQNRWIDSHYKALAICPDDIPDDLNTVPTYLIRWEILPETWEYWDNGGEDEGDACDWDNPENIREYGGWDLDTNRFC